MVGLKKVLLAGLAALLAVTAFAAGVRRVAVLEFRNNARLSADDSQYLTDAVVRGTVREALPVDQYLLMNRENMITLLQEQNIRLEQVCEGECELDVGRKIGAHYIVTGSIYRVGSGLKVTVKLIETASGNLLRQTTVQGADTASLDVPLKEAVRTMMSILAAPAGSDRPVFAAPGSVGSGPAEGGVSEVRPSGEPAAGGLGLAGLYISTDPPGADVYLGAVRAGSTSPAFQKTDLQPGTTVRVTLRKAEYHDKLFDVELKAGISKFSGVKLAPAFGTLVIESDPPGARVTVGDRQGVTPYRNERMPSGHHLVSVEMDLYAPVRNEVVEVKDGETTQKRYLLGADFGTVSVDSSPRGASILVSGREAGRTPAELRLSPGTYEVALQLAGYRQSSLTVTVAKGSRLAVPASQATLVPRVFNLSVYTDPPMDGARIHLDGADTGKDAPEVLAGIAEGSHAVEVRAGKLTGRADVAGRDGEQKAVTVALKGVSNVGTGSGSVGRKPGTAAPAGMVLIPGGTYWMGCVPGDTECQGDEKPRHQVTVDSFYMDAHEVTQAEYERVMGKNPSSFKNCGGGCPVENVSWEEARGYCEKVGGRLPTEAEWEYAARGGREGEVRYGELGSVAWYDGNSGRKTHPVGQKAANGYGLYDILGNVWEWCADWYGADCYASSPGRNPTGPTGGSIRVLRGGGWYIVPRDLRSSDRNNITPGSRNHDVGFRCARD